MNARSTTICFVLATCGVVYSAEDHSVRLREIIEDPSTMGEDGVDVVLAELHQSSSSHWHAGIAALRQSGTAAGLSALLNIALESDQPLWRKWAAQNYIGAMKEKLQSTALLKSSDPEIRHMGLISMRGCDINHEVLDCLQPYLHCEALLFRRAAAYIILEAPIVAQPKETAAAIIDSMKSVFSSAEAYQKIAVLIEGDWMTAGGYTLRSLIFTLSKIASEDTSILHDLLPADLGHTREAVIAAMAFAGDGSIKPELLRMARDAALPEMRMTAVAALSIIVEPEDIGFLQQIVESDTFEVSPTIRHKQHLLKRGVSSGQYYPVRDVARQIIHQIERGSSGAGPSK